jgi:hypothetical protein
VADSELQKLARQGVLSPEDPLVIEAVRRGLLSVDDFAPSFADLSDDRTTEAKLKLLRTSTPKDTDEMRRGLEAVRDDRALRMGLVEPGRYTPPDPSELEMGDKDAVGAGLATALSSLGAVGGGAFGGPPGALVGGALGSGAARLLTGGSAREAGRDALIDAAVTTAIPVAGAGLGRLAKAARIRRMVPGGAEAFEAVAQAADEATGLGLPVRYGTLPPGTISESGALKNLERVTSGMIGGAPLREAAEEGGDLLRGVIQRRITPAMLAAEAVDNAPLAVQKAVKATYRQWLDEAGELYKKVDDLAAGQLVDMAPVERAAQEILEGPARIGSGQARAHAVSRLKEVLKRGNTTTFEDAHALRSDLLEFIVGEQRQGRSGRLIPHLKRVQGMIDEAIDGTTGATSPAVQQTLHEARRRWRVAKETFENGPLRGLIRADPERAIRLVAGTRSPRVVEELRKILDPEDFDVFRGAVVDDLLTKSGARLGEEIPFGLGKQLTKHKGLIESLYPEDGARILRAAQALDVLAPRLRTSPTRGAERDLLLLAQGATGIVPTALAAGGVARLLSNRAVATALVRASLATPGTPGFQKLVLELDRAVKIAMPGVAGATAALLRMGMPNEPEAAAAAGGAR